VLFWETLLPRENFPSKVEVSEGLKRVASGEALSLMKSLGEDEYRAINLSSRVIQDPGNLYTLGSNNFAYLSRKQSSSIYFSDDKPDKNEIAQLVQQITGFHPYGTALLGLESDLELLRPHLPIREATKVHYFLMIGPVFSQPIQADIPISFHLAKPSDIWKLGAIQKDYELEEVLLNPRQFSAALSFHNLKKLIREQRVFYAKQGTKVVAKANTNAQGIGFDQIGGVFTVQSMRRRHINAALMSHLLIDIQKRGKRACLFVKRDNVPAISLYQSLRFSLKETFAIHYLKFLKY
jgi:hypothetical protein